MMRVYVRKNSLLKYGAWSWRCDCRSVGLGYMTLGSAADIARAHLKHDHQRITDDEYNDIYDRIYQRLKDQRHIFPRGDHDYISPRMDSYLDGVEDALQEVQKLGTH